MAMAAALNGNTDHILRPRPVKPGNPIVLRAQSKEGTLRSNGNYDGIPSGMSRYMPLHSLTTDLG